MRGSRSWIDSEERHEGPYELLHREVEGVVEECLSQIQQMHYSRRPEQSAARQILPHFHSVEMVLLGHCSAYTESSRGTCAGQEDEFLLEWVGLERLAAAKVRGWRYWAAGLGIRVVDRGLFGRRLLSRYPVESTTFRRLDREISRCVDVSNGRGVKESAVGSNGASLKINS